jgi:hypothetical protein
MLRVVGHDAVRSPMSTADMLVAGYTLFSRWGDMFTLLSTMSSCERQVGVFLKVAFSKKKLGVRAQDGQP